MENYGTSYGTIIKNAGNVAEYLKKYFDYKLPNGKKELKSEEIFQIIKEHMSSKSFGKYLKEYICKKEPDKFASDGQESTSEFIKYCTEKFRNNGLIGSASIFEKKKTAMSEELLRKQLRNWFGNVTPSRESVFLLAFALEMNCEQLSEFLTKGLCCKNINYKNPAEVAAYSCLKNKKQYSYAIWLLKEANKFSNESNKSPQKFFTDEYRTEYEKINTEEELIEYIAKLISEKNDPKASVCVYDCYKKLLESISEYAVLDKKIAVENETGVKILTKEEISFGTVERYIYYYTPVKNGNGHYKTDSFAPYENGNIIGKQGNLMKDSKWFFSTLLRRSDLQKMYSSEKAISRDTILTLSFFTVCEENPYYGTYEYISDINDYLNFCRFEQFNFSYPYDMFIFMCLQTDDPPATFRKIWEMSWIK